MTLPRRRRVSRLPALSVTLTLRDGRELTSTARLRVVSVDGTAHYVAASPVPTREVASLAFDLASDMYSATVTLVYDPHVN